MYEDLKDYGIKKVSILGYKPKIRKEIANVLTDKIELINNLFRTGLLRPKLDALIVKNEISSESDDCYYRTNMNEEHKIFIKSVVDFNTSMYKIEKLNLEELFAYHIIRALTTYYVGRDTTMTEMIIDRKYINVNDSFKMLIKLIESTKYFKTTLTKNYDEVFALLFKYYVIKEGQLGLNNKRLKNHAFYVEKEVKAFGLSLRRALIPLYPDYLRERIVKDMPLNTRFLNF